MVRIAVLAALLVTVFTGVAHAEDREAARKAYAEGATYYDLNQYPAALAAFTRAYWNYAEPSFLFNIAQCHRALKHKREAMDFYRSYLRKAPSAPNREDVQAIIAELEQSIAKDDAATAPLPHPTTGVDSSSQQPASGTLATPDNARPKNDKRSKAWVWGVVIGGVVAVGLGVGLGVGLSGGSRNPVPSYGRGTLQ